MTPPSRSAGERNRTLGLGFTISQRSAKPGDVVQFPLFVSNSSGHPWKCRYRLEADKQFEDAWTVVAPDALGAAQRRQGHMEVRVPKGLQPGTYPLSLHAIPNDSTEPAVAEAVLVVEAKRCVFLPSPPKFDLQPDGSVIATLSLGNCGNIDCKASIQIRHKEGWKFEIDSPDLTINSGIKGVNVKLKLRPPSGKSARAGDEVTLTVSWQGQTLLVQPLKGHIKVKFGSPPIVRNAIVVGSAIVAVLGGLGIWAANRTPRDSVHPSGLIGHPTALDFGARPVGDASEAIQFTTTNGGTEELIIDRVRLAGAGRSDFSLGPNGCAGAALPSKGSCTVVVRFRPSRAGSRNAELVIGRNGKAPSLATALVGTGTAGRLVPVPTQVRFTSQAVTTRSPAEPVTVTNHGTAPIVIAATGLAGANPGDFVRTRDRCSTVTLAPSQTCLVEVAFAPAVGGGRSATLTIEGGGGETIASVALTGQATATGQQRADLSVDTLQLDFHEQRLGTSSGRQTLRVRNNARDAVRLERVTITGSDSGDFTRPRDTCSRMTVAPFDLCFLDVVFTPGGVGGRSATLTIPGGDPARPLTVALTGTGTAPTLDVSRGGLDFPNQQVGAPSEPKSLTLTNSGTAPASISVTGPSGANRSDFALGDGCGRSLPPGTSCTVTVRFKPTAIGARRATLTITHDAPGSPALVALWGNGSEPGKPDLTVAIVPESLQYGCLEGEGCTTSFQLLVRNVGIGDVPGTFAILVDEPEGESTTLAGEAIKAGKEATYDVRLPGYCYCTVIVDPENVVAESDETNNSLEVVPPD